MKKINSLQGIITVITFIVSLSGCSEPSHSESPSPLTNQDAKADMKQEITVTGAISFKNIEGGFFALTNKNGEKYTLMGLKPNYQKDGLVVSISGYTKPDMMTTSQYGQPLYITSIQVIDDSQAHENKDL